MTITQELPRRSTKRLLTKRLAAFLIDHRIAVPRNHCVLEEAVGQICMLLLLTVVRDHDGDYCQLMQGPATSQCAEREAPGKQMMNLSGDTTGARIQADQGFKDGVEFLVVGLLKMYTVELAPDLFGEDHNGVEAIESLAPLPAQSPLEPSIRPLMVSEYARCSTYKVSRDLWGDVVQCLVQRRECQFQGLLKAHASLHDLVHARSHRVEDVVIPDRCTSP
jgi:hypothetical protein